MWRSEINERIFNFLFSNNAEKVFDCVRQNYRQKLEFEFRFADSIDKHCGVQYWNLFNAELKPYTGLMDDVIITYKNPNFNIRNTLFREYRYGHIIQRKHCISKFATDSANMNVIPFIFKLSHETNIESLNELKTWPKSFARTFRQSFRIDTENKYLLNWSIDKTIRFITKEDGDYVIRKRNLVEKIEDTSKYDILDFEFEFTGEWQDLTESLVELFNFIYLRTEYRRSYRNISNVFMTFDNYTEGKLASFIVKPRIFDDKKRYSLEVNVPEESHLRTVVYISDEDYVVLSEDSIDLTHAKRTSFNEFSVLSCFVEKERLICVDIYFHQLKNVSFLKLEKRRELLEELVDGSEVLEMEERGINGKKVYLNDSFNEMLIVPEFYYVCLRLKLSENQHDFYLYAANNITASLPLLKDKLYKPSSPNENFDNKTVKFQLHFEKENMKLKPMEIVDSQPSTLQETLQLLFAAYAKHHKISIQGNERNDKSLLSQISIEKFSVNIYNNIYLYSPNHDAYLVRNLLNYCKTNDLVVKMKQKATLNNLNVFYSGDFVEPILNNSNIVPNNTVITCLDEGTPVSSLERFYDNDMSFVFVPFFHSNKLWKLANIFSEIITNVKPDGRVVFNYINSENDVEKFVFDEVISKHKLASEDVMCIKSKLTKQSMLIKTQSNIGGSLFKTYEKCGHDTARTHKSNVYTKRKTDNRFYNYLFNAFLSEKASDDFTLFCITKLASLNLFRYEIKTNLLDKKTVEKITNDTRLLRYFEKSKKGRLDTSRYSCFKTIILTF